MTTWTLERINALAERLKSKNCHRLAGTVYQAGVNRAREAGQEPSSVQWMRLGHLLRSAGDPAAAAAVYRQAAHASMKAGHHNGTLLMLLRNLCECCIQTGQPRAARRIRALHDRIAAALDDDPDKLLPVNSARVLASAASRCTFMLEIDWQSLADLEPVEEDGFTVLRDRVRLGDASAPWLEFEAKVPCEPAPRYPHVTLRAALPWRLACAADRRPVFELVNEINRGNPTVSACLETESGQIVVRGELAFSGFHTAARAEMGIHRHIHEELVINLMLNVLQTASGWRTRVAHAMAQSLGIDCMDRSSPLGDHGVTPWYSDGLEGA